MPWNAKPGLTGIVAGCILSSLMAAAPDPEAASIVRHGDISILAVHTFRPLDAIATALESQFGIAVSAEDPLFQFRGDMMDISPEVPKLRKGTLVPARWGFEVQFATMPDGAPRDVRDLLNRVVAAANAQSQFAYRLDEDSGAFSFVPTRTHDPQGNSIEMTPLLDRPVTILQGVRRINESAALMADELSKQTGMRVSCCQSSVAGIPWGMDKMAFGANGEPARVILKRLGLSHWHVRCDETFCTIDMR